MILDIEENEVTPIILGKLFLNTIGTLIDVKEGKLTWWLGDEEEVFKVFGTTESSFSPPFYNFVQVTNKMEVTVVKPHPSVGMKDPPRNKVIPKNTRCSKKKGDDITTQALGYGVGNYTRGLVKNIMFEVG